MIEKLIVITGLVLFVNQLFEKWNVWNKIEEFGTGCPFKWLYSLTRCRFCLLFHVSWIVSVFVYVFSVDLWGVFIAPFVISGLIQISIKK